METIDSTFDKKLRAKNFKENNEELIELYKIAVNVMLNENETLWQSSNYFLIANTILIAAISQLLFSENLPILATWLALFISGVGIFICVLWSGTYSRRFAYYEFRVAQVRQKEPKGWSLINGDGKNFAEGKAIHIQTEDKGYYLNWHHRLAHTKRVIMLLIISFFVVYIFSIVISLNK